MEVRKSDGSFEEYDRKKLLNIVKKAFKTAGIECNGDCAKEIVDSLYIYDGILCSSIRRQLEERFGERDEKVLEAYKSAKEKEKQVKNFVESKKAFINSYKKASNTANATIDDNSNVANKNIAVINAEIHKPENLEMSRSMVMDKLKELYPNFNAKNYIKDLKSHIIYKHDESSFAGAIAPYTYSSKEVINVMYNGNRLLIPFDKLWDVITEESTCVDDINDVYQKYPENLFVYDRDKKWTVVTHITKKKRHRDLVRVKTSFGEDVVVTDNHPMIINPKDINETIEAIDSIGKIQCKIGETLDFNGVSFIDMSNARFTSEATDTYCFNQNERVTPWCKRYVNVDWRLGYFVGFFIGDGNFDNTDESIHFTQNNRETLLVLNSIIFEILGIAGRIYQKKDIINCYVLDISSDYLYWLLRDYFNIEDKSCNKTLPFNIYDFTEDFAKGILCGLIDSDGTVNGSQVSIRLASRAAILQVTDILRHFGFGVGNTMQSLPFSNNSSYKTNYTLWGVNFSIYKNSIKLGDSYKLSKVKKINGSPKYKINGETKIVNVQKLSKDDSYVKNNEYIYDITTNTRTFALNNLLVHNCVSVTMYPFLTNGIKGIGGLSAAPKNIDSYCGMYCNLVFAVSSQYAGAVATSEFLLYFAYFCKKEWGEDFWKHPNDFYKVGPDLRELLNKTHYWVRDIEELAAHDFGRQEYNDLRDKIVNEATRPLTKEELKEYAENITSNPDYTLKLSDGTRTIAGQIRQYWQQIVYTINQPCAARGFQSAFVNFSYFDKPFFDGMFGDFYFPDGSKPDWESLKWTQKEFMQWFNEERNHCMLTFPVESLTLLYKDGKFEDEEMFTFACEEYARGHSFFTYISDTVDSLSSCCRLKNKIQTKEFNFTNGNMGIQTGSKSVITLNLSRIIQDWASKEFPESETAKGVTIDNFFQEGDVVMTDSKYTSLKKYMNKILERVYKYHTAYNELLWDMYDSDLLPVYKAGFIDLNKQYLTIGINGLNQAAEFLGIQCTDNPEYSKFCRNIFSFIKEQNTLHKVGEGKHKLTFNTECVPAESLAGKNYNWDKEDGYWVPNDVNLYTSYIFKPNDKRNNAWDRIRLHGSEYIGDYLDGGSACHMNISKHPSVPQAKFTLTYAAKNGCSYITFNRVNSECADCHHIVKEDIEVCPVCGSEHIYKYDRVIGYITRIDKWGDARQKEQKGDKEIGIEGRDYIELVFEEE